MSLADEIQIVRHSAFLTQLDFANELNVAFSTVNRWETGKSSPNQSVIKMLKEFCEDRNIDFSGIERERIMRRLGDSNNER